MPDESAPHLKTWMAFVANESIWSRQQILEVKKNLIAISATIAKYEPVSMLVNAQDYDEADDLLEQSLLPHHYPVELVEFTIDDFWLRDTGPTFVFNSQGKKRAIDFNFNGWGNKQQHYNDKQVARFIAQQSGTTLQKTHRVLEGGCFEVDGHGTAIMTKSCIVNHNRNPHLSFKQIDTELKALLGLRKIIWLEGVKGKDITDGHTDFYARFIRPGEVVVSRENDEASFDYQVTRDNIATLSQATDADGNALKLQIMDAPNTINERFGIDDFAAGYIGYYVMVRLFAKNSVINGPMQKPKKSYKKHFLIAP